MNQKTLLHTLTVLQELGLDPNIPEALRTKAQDAHDALGRILGLWDETGSPARVQVLSDLSVAAHRHVNKVVNNFTNKEYIKKTLDTILMQAEQYGISTDGKNMGQIQSEIREAQNGKSF